MESGLSIRLDTKEFDKAIDLMVSEFPKTLQKIVYQGTTILEGEIIENLSRKKRWARGGRYLGGGDPSVLGIVTGRLRASVIALPPKTTGTTIKGELAIGGVVESSGGMRGMGLTGSVVGQSVNYARKHEFGIGVRPRPYIRPAIEATKDKIFSMIKGNITEFLRSKGRCPHCGKAI
ncbi:hypothetical protein KKG63_03590 [Patescibacteria group bacterium]|nr:hypothetical protein [Patescibacteria group bacterium]MBU1999476.1 hypothetical protein [Candidatus Omnitrophota bacterium]